MNVLFRAIGLFLALLLLVAALVVYALWVIIDGIVRWLIEEARRPA